MSVKLPVIQYVPQRDAVKPPRAPAEAHNNARLHDSHGRVIRDLRLSVTDRCNFRCTYCMDPDFRYLPKRELLTLREYLVAVEACVSLGIEKLRITGGEPTLYPDLLPLIRETGRMNLQDVAMTTNGTMMTTKAAASWREAGLSRVTLSLDTLRNDRMRAITRCSTTSLDCTISAINAAHAAGLTPVKVNAVVMRGVNDDELEDFADFAREHDVHMRFIEFMPLDSGRRWLRETVVSAKEIIAAISARHRLVPVGEDSPDSTSLNYRFADDPNCGGIGVIAPVTSPFCGACSRLRITADGKVRPCLFSNEEWDLKPLLRGGGATPQDIRAFLIDAMWTKQAGHGIGSATFTQPERPMSAIGG